MSVGHDFQMTNKHFTVYAIDGKKLNEITQFITQILHAVFPILRQAKLEVAKIYNQRTKECSYCIVWTSELASIVYKLHNYFISFH